MNKRFLYWEDENKQLVDISDNHAAGQFLQHDKDSKVLNNLPATWLEIDLSQLKSNYEFIKQKAGNEIGVIGVLKSDAYGHGIVPVAQTLQNHGIEKIGVGSIEELLVLRRNGIHLPVLMLYPILSYQLRTAIDLEAELTVVNQQSLEEIDFLAKKANKQVKIHLQIETGLNRFGIKDNGVVHLAKLAGSLGNISIEGISTHFADPESNEFTQRQFDKFLSILKTLSENNISIPTIHTSNSGAIMLFPKSYDINSYNTVMPNSKLFVRPGGLLYGTYAHKNKYQTPFILSSMFSHIVDTAQVEEGENVGYFQQFTANKTMLIATVPVGWGNNGYLPANTTMQTNNKLLKGVGLISSNNLALDCNDISCKVGDRVWIINSNHEQLSIENLAKESGMFVNRLLSILGSNNRRVYFEHT